VPIAARARAVFTRPAQLDLREIATWVTVDGGPARARLAVGTVRACAADLAATPLIGRARPELGQNVRSFPLPPYVLFYRPAVRGGLLVLRVVHGARHLPRALQERPLEDGNPRSKP
jgi:toxin ParE1/3/4